MVRTAEPLDHLSPTKRAIIELREMRARIEELERAKTESIAIVGMGLRFPGGAHDPESLWRLLRDGVDTVTEVPPDRWDINAFYDPDPDAPGKMSTRCASFLDDVEKFDADFFGISRREAVTMDPQQRLLMTVAWEALENAGQSPHQLMGSSTGVFVGVSNSDYLQIQIQRSEYEDIDAYLATGTSHSVASGRLSYFLGLHGPSLSMDTACSSSLVAVHLACQSLRAGECNLALAGGVNLILAPELLINLSKAHMMAADGRCKVFDAAADGFVRGEGAGIVVLKRLSDGLADGDRILAVIRGSAVNQDGRSNGLTAPNGPSQQAVIRQALHNAGIKPEEIGYVETHGTGTALGDPIEVQALAAVLTEERTLDRPLPIGSIKANIGHLESASGAAGLIKTILALQHQEIPPHLHLKTLNPYIPWKDLRVIVPTVPIPWSAENGRRVAGVSSFGFSGTNAHVLLEETPRQIVEQAATERVASREEDPSSRSLYLLNLSAKTESGLKELAARYEKHLGAHPEVPIADVCYTASVGRAHFDYRLSLVAGSTGGMRQKLAAFVAREGAVGVLSGRSNGANRPEVVFLFTGQDGQYLNVGRMLFETEPGFRSIVKRCDALLRRYLEKPLLSILYPEPGIPSPLHDTRGAQPAIFVVEYALAELWRSWGIEPGLVMGDGLGEIVAATVAGMMSLEEGLALATERDDQVEQICSKMSFKPPRIALFSAVSLQMVTADNPLDATHWRHSRRDAVRLGEAMESLYRQGYQLFLEIGPTPLLLSMGQKCFPTDAGVWLPSLHPERDDWEQMLESLSTLYMHGINADWNNFYRHTATHKVALPTYPFAPRRFWIEPAKAREKPPEDDSAQPKRWEGVVAAAQQQSRQVPLDLALHTYQAKWRSLDHLTTAYMAQILEELGAFTSPREQYSVDALSERFGVLPTYKVLMGRWLKKLAVEGWLQGANGNYVAADPWRTVRSEVLLREAKEQLADMPFIVEYLEHCRKLAVAVLTGRISALETLFSGGSTDFAEQFYERWSYSRYYNAIVRAALDGIVRSWPQGRQLRCVEIGAGTGGTTASILPVLPPERTLYCFTDVSEFFFNRATEKFHEYPFVRYGILDIEKSPEEQGYGPHDFDVVVAANVLHATRNIKDTISRVMSLLVPGGILLLYEVTTPLAWFDTSVALVEGWELFSDALRLDSPLLSGTQWHDALRTAGFTDVRVYPETSSPAEVLGSHVILACMPDVQGVQQRLTREYALDGDFATRSLSAPQRHTNGEMTVATIRELLENLREMSPVERRETLVDYVRRHVARVLRRESSNPIERQQRLMDLGIDSLMALELRNLLGTGLGLTQPLPATLIFDYPTIEAVAVYVDNALFGEPIAPGRSADASSVANVQGATDAEALAHLSEAEVTEMLRKKLQTM
jgi:acyl transferase domain-containing protein/SAM-dependent methyltransferase